MIDRCPGSEGQRFAIDQQPSGFMSQFRRPEELLTCSFCGKSQNDVRKLIAGPGVYICNECIDICNEIINDDEQAATPTARTHLPKPAEIRAFLDEYVIGQDESKKRL